MKQYVKDKPIKGGFKFWFRCASKMGYLPEMDMYLGKKQQVTGPAEPVRPLRPWSDQKFGHLW